MQPAAESQPTWDAARLVERYGEIPMDRIRTNPPPETATVDDVVWFSEHEDRLYEYDHGLLIEKTNDRYADVRDKILNAEQILELFGPIPLRRICTDPPPGLGTEEDVIRFQERENRLFELVHGVLVEKEMGAYESLLASELIRQLGNFVKPRKLGTVLGEAGLLRLATGDVRIPDVAFLSIKNFPKGRFPKEKIAPITPDIAVEVLSDSNTRREMTDKLNDYFAGGTRLVWYFDPKKRQVDVYDGPQSRRTLTEHDTLDGGDVLPGFEMKLFDLFNELPPE
jgi:Uma2 family endonuclease